MDTASADRVISKKARAAREGTDTGAVSPAKALRLALSKAADDVLDLTLTVSTLEQSLVTRAELVEAVAGAGLLILTDGTEARRGAVRLDFATIASIIECQTIGYVSDREAVPRGLTRTDAALVAPWIDAVLEQVADRLADRPDSTGWTGYEFGAMVEDAHGLGLALEADRFHHFRVSVSISAGVRAGVIDIAYPKVEAQNADRGPEGQGVTAQALGAVVRDAPVTLHAVLGRVAMPLKKSLKLKVGDILCLTSGSGLDLQLEGTTGHVVSRARLGQMDGARAVRLMQGSRTAPNDRPAQLLGAAAANAASVREPDAEERVLATNPASGPEEPAGSVVHALAQDGGNDSDRDARLDPDGEAGHALTAGARTPADTG